MNCPNDESEMRKVGPLQLIDVEGRRYKTVTEYQCGKCFYHAAEG